MTSAGHPSISTTKRIDYLDSARGFAAIFVVWGHFLYQYGFQDAVPIVAHSPLRFFYNAVPAVSFFFVLSGLVLAKKYLDKRAELNIGSFYVARLFRIYPAFLVVLLLSILCAELLYHNIATTPPMDPNRDFWSRDSSPLAYLKESILFYSLEGSHLFPQLWSLIVEMQVSLLIPFFIILIEKKTAWFIIFILSCMLCFLSAFTAIFLLHFGLGIIIAKYFNRIGGWWSSFSWIKRGLLILLGIGLFQYRHMVPYLCAKIVGEGRLSGYLNVDKVISLAEGIGSAILIFCIVGSIRLQRFLNFRPFTFIGKISYSIYLCHFIILYMALPYFFRFLNSQDINRAALLLPLGLIFVTIGVLALSTILYYLIEKPFIAYGKTFYGYFYRKNNAISK
jgi:peptidoglycan/LPS O-acetylase OafA/YrhL